MSGLYDMLAFGPSRERFEQIRQSFKPGQGDSKALIQVLMLIAVAVVVVVVGAQVVAAIKRRKTEGDRGRSATALFRDALKSLGVSWVDRLLLVRVARHAQMESPCLLVFTPEMLDRHARRWVESLPVPALRRRIESRFAHLAGALFVETASS